LIQNATDTGQGSLIFFLFDLLHLDGENLMALPLVDRKTRLASLLNGAPDCLRYNDHQIDHGPAFHRLACGHGGPKLAARSPCRPPPVQFPAPFGSSTPACAD
jgi:bifunctional non-homologous end joining protein LigD